MKHLADIIEKGGSDASQIFEKEKLTPSYLSQMELWKLTDEAEVVLIKELASWPRVVEGAAQAHEPNRIAFFLTDLAGAFPDVNIFLASGLS